MRVVTEWTKLYNGEKRRSTSAKSALFVCNKWDDVEIHAKDQTEKENLQKDIISKLKKKSPELDEKSQVIRISVFRAAQVQHKFNVMSDDLNSLINGIQRLLPLCIEMQIEDFYW